MSDSACVEAVGRLRSAMSRANKSPFVADILEAKDEVLARYNPIFSIEHLPELQEVEVKSFLRFENNRHWTGLHRQGNRICSDMDKLRETLGVLLDEAHPLDERVTRAVEDVYGMGKAIVSAILLLAYPDQYGVWNNTSEGALRLLDIWPSFEWGASLGEKYVRVNEMLNSLADELDTDLWTLDGLFWLIIKSDEMEPSTTLTSTAPPPSHPQILNLGRYLHEFLRDNWEQTELGQKWAIYEEDGDPDAGYEFPCDVGCIDLLARHRREPAWLVIELKRGETGDSALGQVLRYMGWVQAELAERGEEVKGLIIAPDSDEGLRYALQAAPNVELQLYTVQFHLHTPSHMGE